MDLVHPLKSGIFYSSLWNVQREFLTEVLQVYKSGTNPCNLDCQYFCANLPSVPNRISPLKDRGQVVVALRREEEEANDACEMPQQESGLRISLSWCLWQGLRTGGNASEGQIMPGRGLHLSEPEQE